MSKVKKVFEEVIGFLEANADKKVKTVLDEVIALCAPKQGGGGGHATTFVKNAAGQVIAVFCYYHKKWMHPAIAEFGAKASTSTGLNSMCKDGVSKWTKQQREFKAAQSGLLTRVASGDLSPADLAGEMAKLEEAKNAIVPREDGYGFDSAEACIQDAIARGHDVGEYTLADAE